MIAFKLTAWAKIQFIIFTDAIGLSVEKIQSIVSGFFFLNQHVWLTENNRSQRSFYIALLASSVLCYSQKLITLVIHRQKYRAEVFHHRDLNLQ